MDVCYMSICPVTGPTESSSQGTWMRRQRILNRVEEISESSADEVADDDDLENQVPPSKKTWEGSHWEKVYMQIYV